jgi:hypothetical protein
LIDLSQANPNQPASMLGICYIADVSMGTRLEFIPIKQDIKAVNLKPHSHTFLLTKFEEKCDFYNNILTIQEITHDKLRRRNNPP